MGAGAAKAVVAAATAPAAARPEPEAPRLITTPAIDRSQYETVTTEADLDRWIAAAYAEGVLAIDMETDSLDSITGGLAGICIRSEEHTSELQSLMRRLYAVICLLKTTYITHQPTMIINN